MRRVQRLFDSHDDFLDLVGDEEFGLHVLWWAESRRRLPERNLSLTAAAAAATSSTAAAIAPAPIYAPFVSLAKVAIGYDLMS